MELVRGVVVSFEASSYTATVRYEESLSTVQTGVPVSRSIPAWQLRPGDGVVVAVFDPLVASDRCVIAVAGVTRSAPGCRVYRNTSQSIPNVTDTVLAWNAVRYDTDGMWNSGTPTRLTAQTAGRYLLGAAVTFDGSSGGGWRQVALRSSVSARVAIGGSPARGAGAGTHVVPLVTDWLLSVGEYVETYVYHDSGGALSVVPYGEPFSLEMWAHWIEA
jgi:hypothetical protein